MKKKFISIPKNIQNLPFAFLIPPIMIIIAIFLLITPRKIFSKFVKISDEREIQERLEAMKPHVKPGFKILDVGAGSGAFLKRVASAFDAKVVGVDIINYQEDGADIKLFDGKNLPFQDDYFDVVFAAFVLHHDRRHAYLVKEMRRVSKKIVIVYEDAFFTPWQWAFVCFNDFFSNMVIGSIKALKQTGRLGIIKMPLPFSFRTINDWCDFFEVADLEVKDVTIRHMRLRPLSKSCFILHKKPSRLMAPTDHI